MASSSERCHTMMHFLQCDDFFFFFLQCHCFKRQLSLARDGEESLNGKSCMKSDHQRMRSKYSCKSTEKSLSLSEMLVIQQHLFKVSAICVVFILVSVDVAICDEWSKWK